MHSEFLMGNEAIALGALAAGVNLAAGYPGTPSTEILETLAKRGAEDIHVEWSVNEKAGLEVAAGAAYSGARALVTMKQVGLNVASDPLMSLAYIGVKGGMVLVVADDPGPISSQTEQDTRRLIFPNVMEHRSFFVRRRVSTMLMLPFRSKIRTNMTVQNERGLSRILPAG